MRHGRNAKPNVMAHLLAATLHLTHHTLFLNTESSNTFVLEQNSLNRLLIPQLITTGLSTTGIGTSLFTSRLQVSTPVAKKAGKETTSSEQAMSPFQVEEHP